MKMNREIVENLEKLFENHFAHKFRPLIEDI